MMAGSGKSRESARRPARRPPKRDAKGRFARAGGRPRKGGRPPLGRRGPSYWANRTVLEIARRLVVVESEVGRLEAEVEGREWRDPAALVLSRMKGIEEQRNSRVALRLATLREALDDMHTDRIPRDSPKRHEEIARRVSAKLGGTFSWRALYREPYRTAWRNFDDWRGRDEVDKATGLLALTRLAKPVLVHRLLRQTARRDLLRGQVRARLLAVTEDGDWTPIA